MEKLIDRIKGYIGTEEKKLTEIYENFPNENKNSIRANINFSVKNGNLIRKSKATYENKK